MLELSIMGSTDRRYVIPIALVLAMCGCSSKRSVREPAAAAPPVAAPPSTVITDPALLTCKTVTQSEAPGYCGILAQAPRADAAAAQKVLAIWKRLESPFHSLTGRESTLVVLGSEARIGEGASATPIPPAAYICPGAPPTVYVPDSLLQLIDNADSKKYPDDFLAFVIGHELGHRMNDLTPDGCELAAFQRPGKGVNEEELADARSAFFITSAGFSATKIARADLVSRFLEAEYKLGRADSKGRHDSLLGALRRFDGYEALYQAGLTLALSGGMQDADRVLTFADELVKSQGVLLPELRVARAIVRINRVSKEPMIGAPWSRDLKLSLQNRRCSVLHPGHSSLWEEPDNRQTGAGPGPEVDPDTRNRALLRESLALLDEAESLGATPFTVASVRTCALLYLADASGAAAAQARAESLAPSHVSPEVTKLLASNRSLVALLQFARANPIPDDPAAQKEWFAKLDAVLGDYSSATPASHLGTHVETEDLAFGGPPRVARPASCAETKREPALQGRLFPAPPDKLRDGSCPTGASLVQTMSAADRSSFTVCRGDTRAAATLVALRLVATQASADSSDDQIAMRAMRPPPALREIETWGCMCAWVERQGVSDRGQIVYRGRCPALGLGRVMLVAFDGHVEEVVDFPLEP